jgi:hypothetical protein
MTSKLDFPEYLVYILFHRMNFMEFISGDKVHCNVTSGNQDEITLMVWETSSNIIEGERGGDYGSKKTSNLATTWQQRKNHPRSYS